jgi:CheY-like chemotaxis protein
MSLISPARILVIEDNGTNRALIVYLLKAFGYKTLEAVDGERGLDVARHERPELIVCDVHLPKLDGYGVVDQLKRDVALRDIPVVAVTALAMVGDRNKILSAGFDGYISKPIEPETFVAQVAAFLPPEFRHKHVATTPLVMEPQALRLEIAAALHEAKKT